MLLTVNLFPVHAYAAVRAGYAAAAASVASVPVCLHGVVVTLDVDCRAEADQSFRTGVGTEVTTFAPFGVYGYRSLIFHFVFSYTCLGVVYLLVMEFDYGAGHLEPLLSLAVGIEAEGLAEGVDCALPVLSAICFTAFEEQVSLPGADYRVISFHHSKLLKNSEYRKSKW